MHEIKFRKINKAVVSGTILEENLVNRIDFIYLAKFVVSKYFNTLFL